MQTMNFKTAWRSLWKNKFYTIINLLGLSLATATFLLLINYVTFERSYESFHDKAANIYRITLDLYEGAEYVVTDCETYPPMGPEFKSRFPEVKDYARLQDMGERELKTNDRSILTEKIYAADPSTFDLFNFQFIKGDSKTALAAPQQAVVTAAIANKLFGSTDAMGKTFRLNDLQLIVTGVIKDVPANTHLKFDILVPFKTIEHFGFDLKSWGGNNNYTYLLMAPGTNLAAFNEKLKAFSKERLKQEIVTAEPMKDIHLYSHKTFEPDINGNSKTVNFLLIISFLVILIGSANYVNLTTARSVEKTKEAGLRKVLGSSTAALAKLFFTESFILNALSMLASLLLVKLSMPVYASIVGEAVSSMLFTTTSFWIMTGALFVLNILLSGIYPAFVLSSVKAVVVTTRNFTGSLKGNLVRRVLVVGQFTVALVVLSAAVIIYQQLYFMRHQNLGMKIDQVLVLKGPQIEGSDSVLRNAGRMFKNELLQVPGVQKVALTASLPGMGLHSLNTNTDVKRYEQTASAGYNYYLYGVDADFVPLMDMQIVAGENFSSAPKSNHKKLLVNEEAARLLGFTSTAAAIGQKIKINGESGPGNYHIIGGVIKNYHQLSLKESQLPMIHWFEEDGTDYYALKVHSTDMQKTLAAIEQKWQASFAGHVFDYYFMDDMYNQQYKGDVQFGEIVNLFSIFTLFITCLGLLGLTAYNVSKRAKEIGIRKVLGASSAGIVSLLSKDFLRLVIIAVVIAVPLCWFTMTKWLQNFAYRIDINAWVFVATGIITILIAFVAISLQAIKAALANPVNSLKAD
ncbi:MAG: ABC transporter permease [Chitinophagaceae bacterium]